MKFRPEKDADEFSRNIFLNDYHNNFSTLGRSRSKEDLVQLFR